MTEKRGAGRKGQITLFIILGIVLLFSTAIILFIKSEAKEEMPTIPEVTETVPIELQPVRDFIKECVKITARDAVEMIGVHGGYIDITPEATQYTTQTFDLDITGLSPTDHEAIKVMNNWYVPYWNYMDAENDCSGNCAFGTKRPPLYKTQGPTSIEAQIDRYIEYNVDECLEGLSEFEKEGFTIHKKGNISARTIITENSVIIFAEYPFEVAYEGTVSKMSQFLATLDVDLGEMYNLATEITTLSVENKFIEQHALNIIAGFSGIDETALPPMAGMDFNFISKRWIKSEVVQKLQDILAIYINMLQATKTENFELNYFPENELKTGLYAQMVLPLEGSYYDASVDFHYLGWPIYFYISPGEVISAREGAGLQAATIFLPFQKYDLPYDVSFPVMVELRDKKAFAGEGYGFFFALESNIRNNEPLTEDFIALQQMSDVTAQLQLCNENQRTSGDVTITTVDTQNKPLDRAMIFLSVGELMCPIGETRLSQDGKIASWTGKFPIGAIGTLVVNHPDAAPYSQEFFRAKESSMMLDRIRMMRYAVKNVTAVKMNLNKEGSEWALDPSSEKLGENEEVVVMLEKIKDKVTEPDVIAAASLKTDGKAEIRIIPGKYKATITLLRDKTTVKIPAQNIAGQEIPEMKIVENGVFPTSYEAIVTFDNSIYGNNEIIFNAMSFNLPEVPEQERTFDDVNAWGNITQYATDNLNYIAPILG